MPADPADPANIWPADLRRHARRPNPADDERRGQFRRGLALDLPGHPTDNRYVQSQKLAGLPSVAVRAVSDWLSGSTVTVLRRRPAVRAKSLATPGAQGRDDELAPVPPDDPLARLFKHLNPVDTWPDFAAQWVQQEWLTGSVFLWVPLSQQGRPLGDVWVLPTAWMHPLPPDSDELFREDRGGAARGHYPAGAWRFTPQWSGVVPGGFPLSSNVVLDARDVLHYRRPHPLWRWDGHSPLTAMARGLDALEAIEESRTNAMNKGFAPPAVVSVDGATQDECDRVAARFRETHAGPRGNGVPVVTDGKAIDIKLLTTAPKDMDFQAGWEQAVKYALAGLGVMPAVAGLTESGSYAAYYSALRQFFSNTLRPAAHRIGAFLTKHLAARHYGDDYVVQVDLPTIDDPDLLERQISSDAQNSAITVNQILALRNRDEVDGGDVPPQAYTAKLVAAAQQPPGGGDGPPGAPPGAGGGDLPEPGEGHPLDALGDAVLASLGAGGRGGESQPDQPDPVAKAFPAAYDESKHARDGGKFAAKPGAAATTGAQAAKKQKRVGGAPGQQSPPPAPTELPAEAADHPKVKAAVAGLAKAVAAAAVKVTAYMHENGYKPEDIIGSADYWQHGFATKHADILSQNLGVSTQTAAGVLGYLLGKAVKHWKDTQRAKAGRPDQPAAPDRTPGGAGGRQDGSDGGPPRPDNPAGAGSLGPRVGKAGAPDLAAVLDGLVADLNGGAW